jgi:ATP-dependent DNA helicase RecQ
MVRPPDLAAATDLLRRHWGHDRLRPAQEPVVRAVLSGRDALAVLPTGGGKSVCFQLPALLTTGLTLVVSPLISLMQDQVAGARRRRIPAGALTSATPPAELARTRQELASGRLKLLYVSPERLESPAFARRLEGVRVARIAVDEAHCISEWGHDFRPAYRRIAEAWRTTGRRRPPVAAFTATATPVTRRDIALVLGLRDPAVFAGPVDRPNLRWSATRVRSLQAAAVGVLAAVRRSPGAAVVYAPTRSRAVRMAQALRRLGIRASAYHAGLPDAVRARVQEAFLSGRLRAVCATSAFGMGVDHPAVRLVAHLGIPGSLEAYVQEAGRAGRDGAPSDCVLVSHAGDETLQRGFIERAWPPAALLYRIWDAMPSDRDLDLAEIRRRCRSRPTAERAAAAVRLLTEFGCVRAAPRTGDPGGARGPGDHGGPPSGAGSEEESPGRWRRGPEVLRRRIDAGATARGRRRALVRLAATRRYVSGKECRRATLGRWFGDRPPPCAGCDRCARLVGARSSPS